MPVQSIILLPWAKQSFLHIPRTKSCKSLFSVPLIMGPIDLPQALELNIPPQVVLYPFFFLSPLGNRKIGRLKFNSNSRYIV